jgi:hypothetical protein
MDFAGRPLAALYYELFNSLAEATTFVARNRSGGTDRMNSDK